MQRITGIPSYTMDLLRHRMRQLVYDFDSWDIIAFELDVIKTCDMQLQIGMPLRYIISPGLTKSARTEYINFGLDDFQIQEVAA